MEHSRIGLLVIQHGSISFVVGDSMNARFPDQFRTAIEVREIGNPSENGVVRLLYIRDISQALFAFLFCVLPSRTSWEKEKTERMQERGGERKRLGCRDNTTGFPSWPAFSIPRIIHFFLPDAIVTAILIPQFLPSPPILSLSVPFFSLSRRVRGHASTGFRSIDRSRVSRTIHRRVRSGRWGTDSRLAI